MGPNECLPGKSKIRTIFIAILLIIPCFFAGCVTGGSGSDEGTLNQEIVVPLGDNEIGMDPFGSSSCWHVRPMIYDKLVFTDRNGIEPGLATSWEVTPDGLTWTFHLRQGIKFHDGTPFNASGVNFSIFKALEGSRTFKFEVASVQMPDEYTYIINLKKPYGPFLDDMGNLQILSPNCYDASGKFVKGIGTGPFIPETYSAQQMVLIANKDYWGGAPKLDKVTIKVIPDATTQIMALEAGEIDLVGADISGIKYAQLERFKNDPDYKIYTFNSSENVFLAMNPNTTFFSDKRVRQAVNYAIDENSIINVVLEGYGTAATGPIGYDASIPWTDTSIQGYTYDVDKAKQLLAEAGWEDNDGDGILEKDGKKFEISFINPGTSPYFSTMCEMIQAQLLKVGIKTNIQTLESGAFHQSLIKKTFDLTVVPDYGKRDTDPYPYMLTFFCSKGTYSLMNNASYDRVYFQMMGTVDEAKKKTLYNEMQQIIMDECNFVFLMHPTKVGIAKSDIKNFEIVHGFEGFGVFKDVYRSDN